MDNELGRNDPYQDMKNRARDDRRPEFLAKSGSDGSEAKKELGEAESAAEGGLYKRGGSAQENEEAPMSPSGFRFTGKGKKSLTGKKSKFKVAKITASAAIVLGILMMVVMVNFVGNPIFIIGNLDYNMQDAVNITGTISTLEAQAKYITGEDAKVGKMPDRLAGDLAAQGVMVGQVKSNGDFVRTNVYLADIDKLDDVAVLGNFQTQPTEEGQLAILYNDEVIRADDFVAAVDSNPSLYMAFSAAIDIGARYWYESKDVEEALTSAGVTRDLFSSWVDKGSEEENRKQLDEILEEGINGFSDVEVGGWDEYEETTEKTTTNDKGEEVTTTETETKKIDGADKVSDGTSGASIVSAVSSKTKDIDQPLATKKAAQILNTAVSSSEIWKAAKVFMGIEEGIQRARIDGDGPVNEIMDLLNEENEIEYTDVTTGEKVKKKDAILTTPNFVAAVSAGKYSKSEAANFSRDSVLLATKLGDDGIIKDTVISTDGQKTTRGTLEMGHIEQANEAELSVVNDRIEIAMVKKNTELIASVVGGNYAVGGGAKISGYVNQMAIAAMASDGETITAYHKEVEELLARRAGAERATKSPFDISSPYTFMGSLARSLANAIVRNKANGTGGAVVGTIASLTGDSVKTATGSVVADGQDDSYMMTHGDHCETVNGAADVEGDIYCNAQTTISTGYMKRTKSDWEGAIDEEEYEDFVTMGMDRAATVGVRSADVCEKYRDGNQSWLGKIVDDFNQIIGLYESCDPIHVPPDVATGANYTFSSSNSDSAKVKEMGGYALYDQVSSLLEGSESVTSRIREEYYAKHPQDNSQAGRLARISGLTKQEAEMALAYADYLTMIANYDPSTRYAFGEMEIVRPEETLVEHANQVASELYVVWHGRTEYDDLRGRTRVA